MDEDRTVNSKIIGYFEKNDVLESFEDVNDPETGAVRHRTAKGWVCEFDLNVEATPDPYCVIEVVGAGQDR